MINDKSVNVPFFLVDHLKKMSNAGTIDIAVGELMILIAEHLSYVSNEENSRPLMGKSRLYTNY